MQRYAYALPKPITRVPFLGSPHFINRTQASTSSSRTMTMEAQSAKRALRKEIKAKLSALHEDEIAKQSKIAQRAILNHPQYQNAKSLSIYLSMPANEAQTSLLVHNALAAGKVVFVPYLYTPVTSPDEGKKRKVMDMLRLGSVQEYESLEKDAWGIPSLSDNGVEARQNAMGGVDLSLGEGHSNGERHGGGLDLVVVPGVAFDGQGNRLGHGAGFYDSFLTRFCDGRKKPYLGKHSITAPCLLYVPPDRLQLACVWLSSFWTPSMTSRPQLGTGRWMLLRRVMAGL